MTNQDNLAHVNAFAAHSWPCRLVIDNSEELLLNDISAVKFAVACTCQTLVIPAIAVAFWFAFPLGFHFFCDAFRHVSKQTLLLHHSHWRSERDELLAIPRSLEYNVSLGLWPRWSHDTQSPHICLELRKLPFLPFHGETQSFFVFFVVGKGLLWFIWGSIGILCASISWQRTVVQLQLCLSKSLVRSTAESHHGLPSSNCGRWY
mmetsp:Transcript_45539/g.108278  ORF Transcript_45539/g.108278 Transcript_45539/m.108278 type:complete len:205 (-) Transcript_45539:862-1476(-)